MSGTGLWDWAEVGREPGDTAIPGSEWGSVARMIRADQGALTQLLQLGLVVLVSGRQGWRERGGVYTPLATLMLFLPQGSQRDPESTQPKLLTGVIGLAVVLLLVLVVMVLSIVCVRKRYCCHHPVSPALPLPPSKTCRAGGRESLGLGIRYVCVPLPVTCCETLGESLPIPKPQFPRLQNGYNTRFLEVFKVVTCISRPMWCLVHAMHS